MALPDVQGRLEEVKEKDARELVHDVRYGLAAAVVFLFALWIRLIPKQNMQYLQALDPYMIARMSEAVITEGHLPLIDVWRYFPYGAPTYLLHLGDIAIPAYLYPLAAPFMDVLTWAQVYPALMGALMVAAMYLAGKELFDRQTGLLAAFFLAAAPAVLHRSSAGWFEKEPIASFLMISSIYLVTRAWKRKSWGAGILSGVAVGLGLASWGGTQFLVLLYPLVMFTVALIDEDIESLLIAFTPTIIIGHVLAAIVNQGGWYIPNGPFVMSLGILGVIWIRYLVDEYRVVEESNLGYVVPGLSVLGAVLLFLSPLYSQGLARYAMQFISKAAQGTGGVIGGTVAENQAAQAGQLIGQLGAFRAQQVLPTAVASASEFFSGWTFSLIGTAILMAVMAGMLARKYSWVDEVRPRVAAVSFLVALLALSAAMTVMLPGSPFTAFLFAIVIAVLGAGLIALFPPEEDVAVSDRWYLLIPLLWILSTLYGATQKSRLIFLTAQPVALMAGYGLSVGLSEVRRLSVWGEMDVSDTDVDPDRILKAVLVLVLVPVVVFNAAAAYGMAQGVGGSPNQLWMQNLDFMREETPKDSVVLSWWDYGYWFETIGGRAAIADGGNMAFYSSTISNGDRINFPLADFLTAENYTEHMDWLDSLSVDYVVLDSSMIGKYSAVSQIHNSDNNQFNAMQTFSCRSQNNRCVTTEANNNTYLIYESRGRRILVPFEQRGGSLEISGTPLMQSRRGTAAIGKVCSEDGVEEIDVGANQSALPGCVAFHPYRQHQTLVYIPQEVVDSTLVELYIMDAHGMEHFDEVFDNGYVKMWKVDYSPNQ